MLFTDIRTNFTTLKYLDTKSINLKTLTENGNFLSNKLVKHVDFFMSSSTSLFENPETFNHV